MSREFGWDLLSQGQILGAFFYGYVLSQVIGAYLAKLYGGKIVLNCAVAGWSLLTVLTPVVAKMSFMSLIVCRVLLGFSEGMAFPVIYHVFSGWVPKTESSRSVVSLNVGTCAGTVLAFVLSPMIIEKYGWEMVFYFFGFGGLVWCVLWQVEGEDRETPGGSGLNAKLLYKLLEPSPLYAIYFCHFAWNVSVYIAVMWLPTYLENHFNLDSKETWINALPYMVMATSGLSWSWIVDQIIAKNNSSANLNWVRKAATGIGFSGGALGFIMFSNASSPYAAVALLCVSFGIASLSLSGWEAAKLNALEPSQAGSLQGVSNTISNFSGVIGVPLASYIKNATNSWHAVWVMCAAIWAMAAVVYTFVARE
eukprot:CAMPEP_0197520436 /NCGR_PEP_ID=MMETSP1318-20131121/5784_1 /TAXON_ID=552666 /ORGANISM="Partenskyella glossopodia, Strain RCC365" /LENGTH=365 /DNA_ID=CAMNT_0043072001 /DNA_START=70 /DNA_END=1164 /DNA_ORIENTATION=-